MDIYGEAEPPRLDERSLEQLAAAGGGRYTTLTIDDRDLDILLSGETTRREAGNESLATDQWREEGPWLLLLLLPLAALAFRRGWVLVAAIAILPLARPAEASLWDDIWLRPDQQASRALEQGAPDEAAELFENPDWRAVAEYRAKNYSESAAGFAEHGDARNLYNLGNALARQGELESAIDAYEQVLEIEPDHADAAYNRDLLQQMVDQQQQQQGEDEQQQSDQQGEGDESESNSESQQGSESTSDSGGEPQDGQSQARDEMSQEDLEALQEELEKAAEEAAKNGEMAEEEQLTAAQLEELRREQEQQQAMEQWLRRIPNDPGALLRNKFRYQYQKLGKDQDGRDTWPDDEVQPW